MRAGFRIDAKLVLADSLKDLAKNKSLERITVQDIVENCRAGRQTFYNHFKDKYDLINWIFKKNADEVIYNFFDNETWGNVLGRILFFVGENHPFYSSALNIEGQNSFSRFLYVYARNIYMDLITKHFGKDAVTDNLIFTIEFNSHGAANTLKQWVEEGMKKSPKLVGDGIAYNMSPDLKKYF